MLQICFSMALDGTIVDITYHIALTGYICVLCSLSMKINLLATSPKQMIS